MLLPDLQVQSIVTAASQGVAASEASEVVVAAGAPQPVADAAPQPVAAAGPQPVAAAGPQPVAAIAVQLVTAAAPQPVAVTGPQPLAAAAPQLLNAAVTPQSVALAAPRKRESHQTNQEPSRYLEIASAVAPATRLILPKQPAAIMLPTSFSGAPGAASQLLLPPVTIPFQQREPSQQVSAATCKMSMRSRAP